MPTFVVHSIPGSPFGRAVFATLEEKGAPYVISPVAPGTFQSEPHISRHPFGRVPVVEHDGFMVYETQAILRYLDRVLPEPSLTPSDPKAAARMDQLLNVNDWYLFHGVGNIIIFQRIVGPRLMGLTPDEDLIAAAMPKAHQVFAVLSAQLGEQTFFTGDGVSLADVQIACAMDMFAMTPEWGILTATAPNLVVWLARMNARPSLQATTWEQIARLADAA